MRRSASFDRPLRVLRKTFCVLCIAALLCPQLFHPRVQAADAATIDQRYLNARLDELIAFFTDAENPYFTTDQQPCTCIGGSDHCKNSAIFNSAWFRASFGHLETDQLPESYFSTSVTVHRIAWQCAGFANFALWYLASHSDSDTVNGTFVGSGTFTAAFMQTCHAGDVLRVKSNVGYHSMIFISADDTGVTVLDCNYNNDCKVQVHKIFYSSWPNHAVGVTRASNVSDALMPEGAVISEEPLESEIAEETPSVPVNSDEPSESETSEDPSVPEEPDSVPCAELYTVSVGGSRLNCRTGPGTDYPLVREGCAIEDGENLTIAKTATASDGRIWGWGSAYCQSINQPLEGWFCLTDNTTFLSSLIPEPPVLTVKVQNQIVTISWTESDYATSYHLLLDGSPAGIGQMTEEAFFLAYGSHTLTVLAVNDSFPYNDLFFCSSESQSITFSMTEPGDLDGDGSITARDYLLLRVYFLGTAGTELPDSVLDVDGNGVVNVLDYLYLRRTILGVA